MSQTRAKAKGRPRSSAGESSHAPQPSVAGGGRAGPSYASGPAIGLGGAQTKAKVGQSGDAYEREADAIASKVASGGTLGSSATHALGPGGVGRQTDATQKPEEKKAGDTAQKADDTTQKPEEKKPEASVQKADTETPEDKKPEEKKPEATAQKADAAPSQAQKPEEKKPEGSVQKADATPEQKVEDKQPQGAVQKADASPSQAQKPEEKKPEANVQKADEVGSEKPPENIDSTPEPDVQMAEEKPAGAAGGASMPEQTQAPPPAPEKAPAPEQAASQSQRPAKAAQAGAGPNMDEIAQQAISNAGPGRAMNPQTRQTLEKRMGADLGDVRIHDDPMAQKYTEQLQARAFTHGKDIWLAAGQTDADVELMAHEVTHVLQQGGGTEIQRSSVQRAPAGATLAGPSRLSLGEGAERSNDGSTPLRRSLAAGASALPSGAPAAGGGDVPTVQRQAKSAGTKGLFDHNNKQLLIPAITLSPFKKAQLPGKGANNPALTIPKGEGLSRPSGKEEQGAVWREKVKPDVKTALDGKLASFPGIPRTTPGSANAGAPSSPNDKSYFFQIGSEKRYLIGFPETLTDAFTVPTWGDDNKQHLFDIDHKHEIQLGGKADISNLWLLDATANRNSGGTIRGEIASRISTAISEATDDGTRPWKNPAINTVRKSYDIVFEKIVDGKDPANAGINWDADKVQTLKPLAHVKALTNQELQTQGLLGSENELVLFLTPGGGKPRKIKMDKEKISKGTLTLPNDAEEWIKGIILSKEFTFVPGQGGTLQGKMKKPSRTSPGQIVERKIAWKVQDLGNYTGLIDPASVSASMKYNELQGFSPIEFPNAYIDETKGIQAKGKLMPSLPLFNQGVSIDIVLDGSDVGLAATLKGDDFKLPGPIKITEASVTISLFTSKLSVEGDIFVEIPNAAKGQFSASADTTGDWGLKGKVEFDTNLFKPAEVEVSYRNSKLSGKGKLGVEKGKIKGIDSAEITASVEDGNIEATGTVKPSIPGIEQASLTVKYGEKTGILIGGDLQLKKDIPGLEGGTVKVELSKKPGEERYRVKASGEAKPKIPGITSMLKVDYDDGAFNANVTAGYEKGMLKGSITVGATNSPVGPDGKPVPGSPGGDKITVYGGGSLTLRLSPWLQGTAAVMLKPNGEIEVKGEIGLPASIDLLPEKAFTKNLFKIGIDIPIVGVSVAGQRIGIFANITGGADLSAGIGPVQLNQLSLSVTYNPDHEDQTLVSGKANLHVPAHAGIRLFVRGGIGVGIPIVSAQAGLEIGGELGLVGALDAGVQLDWSPAKGIVIDAKGSLFVEPKLKVDLTGFVLVEADLLLTTITLYEKKWKLAGFEVGSGLRLGVTFPIHYEEGKPFDISLSDLEFQVPDINPGEVLDNIIKQIV